MFGPWLAVFGWLKQRIPNGWATFKPRLNFITLHCMDHTTWPASWRMLTWARHLHRLHYPHRLDHPLSCQEHAIY